MIGVLGETFHRQRYVNIYPNLRGIYREEGQTEREISFNRSLCKSFLFFYTNDMHTFLASPCPTPVSSDDDHVALPYKAFLYILSPTCDDGSKGRQTAGFPSVCSVVCFAMLRKQICACNPSQASAPVALECPGMPLHGAELCSRHGCMKSRRRNRREGS